MTTRAEAAAAASAIVADRYANAAAIAAREATRAARLVRRPGRAKNVTTAFVDSAEDAVRAGTEDERTLQASLVYRQLAGTANTAKYAAAAASAARYAADAAYQAGAFRAARRAQKAAQLAADWAEMARHRAANSHYAPYTALKTAQYARRAAAAARYAARASGPLGYCTSSAVGLAAALLPPGSRDRYTEEWKGDLCHLPRRKRVRFVAGMLAGAVRLAVVLRHRTHRSGP